MSHCLPFLLALSTVFRVSVRHLGETRASLPHQVAETRNVLEVVFRCRQDMPHLFVHRFWPLQDALARGDPGASVCGEYLLVPRVRVNCGVVENIPYPLNLGEPPVAARVPAVPERDVPAKAGSRSSDTFPYAPVPNAHLMNWMSGLMSFSRG